MTRKLLNRKALREEAATAEATTTVKKKPARKTTSRSRAKVNKEVRLKAYWGVYNQTMKCVARFEYSQRSEADKKANALSASAKTPHFVQLMKEVIAE